MSLSKRYWEKQRDDLLNDFWRGAMSAIEFEENAKRLGYHIDEIKEIIAQTHEAGKYGRA